VQKNEFILAQNTPQNCSYRPSKTLTWIASLQRGVGNKKGGIERKMGDGGGREKLHPTLLHTLAYDILGKTY